MEHKRFKLMLISSILIVFALILFVGGSSQASAQTSLIIDDFKSGGHRARLNSGIDHQIHRGSMIGGKRLVKFIVPENNVFDQSGMFQVRPSDGVMVVSSGYKTFHRIEMAYGVVDQEGHVDPLHLDLSTYDSIQVDFDSNDRGVNFTIVLFSTNAGGRAHLSQSVTARDLPFIVDFSLADFIPVGDFDLSDISVITLIYQSGSAIGSNDYAVSEVRAVGSYPAPPTAEATMTTIPAPYPGPTPIPPTPIPPTPLPSYP